LRIFGADRALLLIEAVAIAKIVLLGIAHLFRRRRPYKAKRLLMEPVSQIGCSEKSAFSDALVSI
jgi:hypothetical protein